MKIKWRDIFDNRTLGNLAIITIGLIVWYCLYNHATVGHLLNVLFELLNPFIIGGIIAYILCAPAKFFDRHLRKLLCRGEKDRSRLCWRLSIAIVLILMLAFVSAVMAVVVPQLISSVMMFANNLQSYALTLNKYVQEFIQNFIYADEMVQYLTNSWQEILVSVTSALSSILPSIVSGLMGLASGITTFFMALIISIYLLSGKDTLMAQVKKVLAALLSRQKYASTLQISAMSDRIFRRYVIGQLCDALLIGVLTFVVMTIAGMPYAILIAVIVGVTNVIPMFGPFIGAVPSGLIVLASAGIGKTILFVVLIVIIQQIDGNILVPRIIGESIGLSGFWVLFAIFVGGGLFGIPGIIIGVPTWSVIYSIIRLMVEKRLAKKGYPVGTQNYREGHPPLTPQPPASAGDANGESAAD